MKLHKIENSIYGKLVTSEKGGKMMLNTFYGMSVQNPLRGKMMLNSVYGMSVQGLWEEIISDENI